MVRFLKDNDEFSKQLINLSISGDIKNASSEWYIINDYKFKENVRCLCGKKDNIRKIKYMYNPKTDNVIAVGKECYRLHKLHKYTERNKLNKILIKAFDILLNKYTDTPIVTLNNFTVRAHNIIKYIIRDGLSIYSKIEWNIDIYCNVYDLTENYNFIYTDEIIEVVDQYNDMSDEDKYKIDEKRKKDYKVIKYM